MSQQLVAFRHAPLHGTGFDLTLVVILIFPIPILFQAQTDFLWLFFSFLLLSTSQQECRQEGGEEKTAFRLSSTKELYSQLTQCMLAIHMVSGVMGEREADTNKGSFAVSVTISLQLGEGLLNCQPPHPAASSMIDLVSKASSTEHFPTWQRQFGHETWLSWKIPR